MDIRDLRYAVTTLDAGGFAPAAERLFVSRQALSQAVRRLEAQLGMRLFSVQDNNRLVPTPDGAAFLREARAVVDAYDALLERFGVREPAGRRPQTLAVALATGAALSLPDGVLQGFRASRPDVVLEVEETNTEGALTLVDEGRADVALVGSHPLYLGNYERELTVPTGLWIAVPRANPLSGRERLVPADLDGQTFVTAGRLNHLHRFFVDLCERNGVHPVIPVTASNPDMLVQLAGEYRALFFAFPDWVRAADASRDVAVLPFDVPESEQFGTYLVRRPGGRCSGAARAFWDYVCEQTRGRRGTQARAGCGREPGARN